MRISRLFTTTLALGASSLVNAHADPNAHALALANAHADPRALAEAKTYLDNDLATRSHHARSDPVEEPAFGRATLPPWWWWDC